MIFTNTLGHTNYSCSFLFWEARCFPNITAL